MLVALRVSNPGGSNAGPKAIATGADEGETTAGSCASWAFRRSGSSRVSQSRCTRPAQLRSFSGHGTACARVVRAQHGVAGLRRALAFLWWVGTLALGLEGAPELCHKGQVRAVLDTGEDPLPAGESRGRSYRNSPGRGRPSGRAEQGGETSSGVVPSKYLLGFLDGVAQCITRVLSPGAFQGLAISGRQVALSLHSLPPCQPGP